MHLYIQGDKKNTLTKIDRNNQPLVQLVEQWVARLVEGGYAKDKANKMPYTLKVVYLGVYTTTTMTIQVQSKTVAVAKAMLVPPPSMPRQATQRRR